MSNIIDISQYFEEGLSYKLGDKLFIVDGSLPAYLNFQLKVKELQSKKVSEESMEFLEAFFDCAFGQEKRKELFELNVNGRGIPLALLMKMAEEIKQEWTGAKSTDTPSK